MTPDSDATHTATDSDAFPFDGNDSPTCTHAAPVDAATTGWRTAAAPTPDAPPGFAIEREIGRGGMGVVFLARQLGLNRPVALKLIQTGDNSSALRFLAEAEAMAAVRHPHVTEVYQFGEHRGRPYLAIEYCPGGDLTERLKGVRMPPADTAKLVAAIAAGVAAAHTAGVVHRDLKPANVLLAADGTPKVTDFGLAKRDGASDLTKTNAVLGTPAYMPPEQARGETKFVGPPADVWAIGVMLYECLCGVRPFVDTDHWALLAAVQRGAFVAPRSIAKDLPRDLELIVLKCLEVEPHERYPSAAELAADLHHWLAGEPISARPVGVIEQAVKWAKRNKKLAGMGLAVFATMAVATGVSVGFGLETEKQAVIAQKKQKDAEDEKSAAVLARNELATEKERTQQSLARALLGPMGVLQGANVSRHERNAVWELASLRDGPVGLLLLDEATRSPLSASQFRERAALLDHAVVGLDPRKRKAADDLLVERLRDQSLPLDHRVQVAQACVAAGRFVVPDVLGELLLRGMTSTPLYRGDLVNKLIAVADRLPPERAVALLTDTLGLAEAQTGSEILVAQIAVALAVIAARVPADRAEAVCDPLAERLLTGMPKIKNWYQQQKRWADGVMAVTDRLPRQRSAEVRRRVAAVFAGHLDGLHESERVSWVCAYATVRAGVTADELGETDWKAADYAVSLLVASGRQSKEVAEAVVALAGRLPEPAATEKCQQAVDVLLAALEGGPGKTRLMPFPRFTVPALEALAARLPAEKAAEVYRRVADILLASVADGSAGLNADRSEVVAEIAAHLSSEQAAEMCRRAIEKVSTRPGKTDPTRKDSMFYREDVAKAVGKLAARLPADEAVRVCEQEADRLFGMWKKEDEYERARVIECLVALAEPLPLDRRWRKGERITEGLPTLVEQKAMYSPRSEPQSPALATAVTGLTAAERGRRAAGPAVGGGAISLSPSPPAPSPLRPQQLVDLLKHPFCVGGLRRAVLDGLEFTYDRKFADLWEFVAFAEREHPELDLLTPPERSEKR